MENIKWQVWVNKNSKPVVMEVPFSRVVEAHNFIWEQIGKRPSSIQKIG